MTCSSCMKKTGADEKPLAQAIVNDGLEQMAALHDRLSRFKAQVLLSIVLQHSRTLRGMPTREAIQKEIRGEIQSLEELEGALRCGTEAEFSKQELRSLTLAIARESKSDPDWIIQCQPALAVFSAVSGSHSSCFTTGSIRR